MTALAVVVAVVGLVAGAWLASLEAVLLRLDPLTAMASGADRDPDLRWAVQHRSAILNVVLVATVAVRVIVTVAAVVVAGLWVAQPWAMVVAGAVMILLFLVFGEVAPRARALGSPERTAARRAVAARRLVRVLGPVARPLVAAGTAMVGRRGAGPWPDDEVPEPDHDPEPVADDERAMIRSILELHSTFAREVMVPRPDMVTVEVSTNLDDLVDLFVERGTSRIPVYREDREDIIGVVYAKDVLSRLASGRRRTWIDLLRPATFVPETKPVDELLEQLQAASVHICLVVDEYGAVIGLLTIEDILEEIVGEIIDEHDDEHELVSRVDDNTWLVDARLGVDDLGEEVGLALPDDDWDTVGGLVVASFGRVPDEGERVDVAGIALRVERVTGRRVARVRVTRVQQPTDVDEDAA